jgi:hypothetical protein
LTPYSGPPHLSSTTYTTFIGIAWSLVGGLVDAIDEFRVPIWRTIKPSAVFAKLKFLVNLAVFYSRLGLLLWNILNVARVLCGRCFCCDFFDASSVFCCFAHVSLQFLGLFLFCTPSTRHPPHAGEATA